MRIVPQGLAVRKNANSEFGIVVAELTRNAEGNETSDFLSHQNPGGVIGSKKPHSPDNAF
jgi:hypothetical protein